MNGRIAVTLTPSGLALKLPEKHRNELIKDYRAKPLRYFPKAPIKKDYEVISKNLVEDKKALSL